MFARVFGRILHPFRKQLTMSFTEQPVVVVLGPTGAGKSKLALEIATEFNGEIISADSMQVYKGLDIISNKVTAEEQQQVPHHMIDIVEPTTTDYSVVKFRDTCLSIIGDLARHHKLPVIVGGTNYYIEAVLWKILVASEEQSNGEAAPQNAPQPEEQISSSTGHAAQPGEDSTKDPKGSTEITPVAREQLERMTTEDLFTMLKDRDPVQAHVLHPNERRKVLRSLEVTLRSGRPMSEHLRLQRSEAGGGALGGPLRFRRACLLWVTADQATLDRRLDARVDAMLERGLVAELADFHRRYNARRLQDGRAADYTRGIFQSIGFKEFHEFLTLPAAADGADGARLLAEGVARLKLVTRRYARKQTRWVRRRLLAAGGRQVPPLYRLDATDPACWEERVGRPARAAVAAWLEGRAPELRPEPPLPPADEDRTTHHCAVCGVYVSGRQQREEHFSSRRHRRAVLGHQKRRREAAGEGPAGGKRRAQDAAAGESRDSERHETGGERNSPADATAEKRSGDVIQVSDSREDDVVERSSS